MAKKEPYSDPRWTQPLGGYNTGKTVEFSEEERKKEREALEAFIEKHQKFKKEWEEKHGK